jgi:hypothetical protein
MHMRHRIHMPRKSFLREVLGFLAVTMMLASIAPRGVGAAEERLSGTVVEIDHSSSTLLLRAGPWQMSHEQDAASIRISITFTPGTRVLIVDQPLTAGANPRGMVRVSEVEALAAGVFATVVVTKTANGFMAQRIEVLADPLRASPGPPPAPSNLTVQPR